MIKVAHVQWTLISQIGFLKRTCSVLFIGFILNQVKNLFFSASVISLIIVANCKIMSAFPEFLLFVSFDVCSLISIDCDALPQQCCTCARSSRRGLISTFFFSSVLSSFSVPLETGLIVKHSFFSIIKRYILVSALQTGHRWCHV